MPTQLQPYVPTSQGLIDIDEFRAEIVRELHAQILAGIHVQIDSPQIGSPNVSVNPDITVQPASVDVRLPGIEALAAQLAETNKLLGRLVYLAEQPVTKKVHRVGEKIDTVTEQRGG